MKPQKQWNIFIPKKESIACNLLKVHEERQDKVHGKYPSYLQSYENPEKVKNAPHNSVVHKIDHSTLDDPEKWAITWRAYLKKHGKCKKD